MYPIAVAVLVSMFVVRRRRKTQDYVVPGAVATISDVRPAAPGGLIDRHLRPEARGMLQLVLEHAMPYMHAPVRMAGPADA